MQLMETVNHTLKKHRFEILISFNSRIYLSNVQVNEFILMHISAFLYCINVYNSSIFFTKHKNTISINIYFINMCGDKM